MQLVEGVDDSVTYTVILLLGLLVGAYIAKR